MKLCAWIIAVAACSQAGMMVHAQVPPDSDGDGMDDLTDVCPSEWGPRSNHGCPVDEEVVFAYGQSLAGVYSVVCPDGSTQIFWDLCPGYGQWGTFRIGLKHNTMGNYIDARYIGDDGYQEPEPEPEAIEVQTDDGTNWTCYGVATGVTLVGGALVAGGVIVGVMATEPPTPSSFARPVYGPGGYEFDDFVYFDPPYEDVHGNVALAAISAGLVVSGSAVVLVGFALHVGCFVAAL